MPSQCRESGVETRCGAVDVEDADIVRQEPRETPHQWQELAVPCPRGARLGVRERIGGNVDVGDLTRGVHTGIGTPRRTHLYRDAEHCRQRVIDYARDRALSGLHSPAGELCSVVSDIEPKTNKPAT